MLTAKDCPHKNEVGQKENVNKNIVYQKMTGKRKTGK